MKLNMKTMFPFLLLPVLFTLLANSTALAEEEEQTETAPDVYEAEQIPSPPPAKAARPVKKMKKRYFGTEKPERIDAGVFHVAFAAGGNFYVEPQYVQDTRTLKKEPTGDYFKDFGFQAGAYFDYDYSELTENVPLALRGMVGYKYILNSVHVFAFDGMVRRIWRLSDHSTFGLGFGGSAAVWYRATTATSPDEEAMFLPSFLVGAGFEFNPFMVDFKWLVNRLGGDNTITGLELYFGFRL